MVSVLITGITGQDGSNMARYLLKKYDNNINIIGCYNNDKKISNINDIINLIILYKLDLNDLNNIDIVVEKYNPDYIINFASAQPQFESNNINFFKINTLSTIQFLDSIIKYNPSPITTAASIARAHRGGNYADWYLPSKDELNILYINRFAIGGFANNAYWSSSEQGLSYAWLQVFSSGIKDYAIKDFAVYVRAIRAF
jgi:nucleoside-diphosphate-sugar epimerase